MVLEQLFKPSWIERKATHSFTLGVIYSFIGIFTAIILFGRTPSLMTVGFTAILLIPSINRLLALEENVEIREKKIHLKQLFKDHKDIFEVYIFMFLGVMLVFSLFALTMPTERSANTLFTTQLDTTNAIKGVFFDETGKAVYSPTGLQPGEVHIPKEKRGTLFLSILRNNFMVLMAFGILSLAYGAGSILFLVWNASLWGTFWGFLAKEGTMFISLLKFTQILAAVFPHMIVEVMSYFFVIIGGGVISKALIREQFGSQKFNHVFTDGLLFLVIALILLVIGAYLEVYVFPSISMIVF